MAVHDSSCCLVLAQGAMFFFLTAVRSNFAFAEKLRWRSSFSFISVHYDRSSWLLLDHSRSEACLCRSLVAAYLFYV